MEVEAALQPPSVRLNTSVWKYAIRQLKLAPKHLIRQLFQDETIGLQAYRIKESIASLGDLRSLEPIQHFYFPLWGKTTPYTTTICPLLKDEAALAHNQKLEQLGPNNYAIYIDAS